MLVIFAIFHYLSCQESLECISWFQIHAFNNAAHDIRPHVLHLSGDFHRHGRGGIRYMKDFNNHFFQLIHCILFSLFILLFSSILLFRDITIPVTLLSTICIKLLALSFPSTPDSQVVQHRLSLAAIHHLLQPLVLQLVAFEVDLLQLGAVSQLEWDFAELVVGKVQHLRKGIG